MPPRNPTTGTEEAKDFKVVVTLDQPTNELRPGLSTTAKITTAHKDRVLRCPSRRSPCTRPKRLQLREGGGGLRTAAGASPLRNSRACLSSTRMPTANCALNFVPVTTGITGATDIEVLSGLKEGTEVVTGPYKTLRGLKDGSLVKRDTVKPVSTTPGNS